MRRRTVLAGALAAPLVLGLGLRGIGQPTGLPAVTLFDARLPQARQAAGLVQLRGGQTRDTRGEVVALLRRERLLAGTGPVLGLTGHAEMLLAADVARTTGRELAPLSQAGVANRWLAGSAEEQWRPLLADVLAGGAGQAAPVTTMFAWIVA